MTTSSVGTAVAEDSWTELQRRGAEQEGRKTGAEVDAERARERELSAQRLTTHVGVFAAPAYYVGTDKHSASGAGLQAGVMLTTGLSLRTEIQVRLGLSLYSLGIDSGYTYPVDTGGATLAWMSPGAVLEGTFRGRPLSASSSWLLGAGAAAQLNAGTTQTFSGTRYDFTTGKQVPATVDLKASTLILLGGVVESVWKLTDSEEWELSVRSHVGVFLTSGVGHDSGLYLQPSLAVGRLF